MKVFNCILFFCIVVLIVFHPSVHAQPLDPLVEGYDRVKAPAKPKLKIVSPQMGSTILGSRVAMEYITSGVKLVNPEERDIDVRGEGYLFISFAKADLYGHEATAQTFIHKSPILFENIPEGEYILTVEVVKNRGDSYKPPVKEEVRFGVRPVVQLSPTPTYTPTPTPETVASLIYSQKQNILLVAGVILLLSPPVVLLVQRLVRRRRD